MRPRGVLGSAILAASAAVAGPSPPSTPPPVPVTTATVAVRDVPIEREAVGTVEASDGVSVRAQVSGRVQSVDFADGQAVRAGALLFQIDPGPFQAAVEQAGGLLARDQVTLANAEATLARSLPMLKNGIVSTQQIADMRAEVASLHDTVASDRATLAGDRVQLGFTSIRAPVDGILGLRLVDVGNVVAPASGPLVVLNTLDPVLVVFPLPQADLPAVVAARARAAAAGRGGPVVEAWSEDGGRQIGRGTLVAIGNQIGATNGAVMLEARFENADQRLWPGATVTARLRLETVQDGLTVPVSALDQAPSGSIVWSVDAAGLAHATPVTVRQILRGTALIASGVAAGESVVTDGQYGLTDGAQVHVQNGPPPANAAPLRTNQPGRLGISP